MSEIGDASFAPFSSLQIEPLPHDHYQGTDYFGNRTDYFSIQQPHDRLVVTAVSDVAVGPVESSLFEQGADLAWETVREQLRNDRSAAVIESFQFTLDSPMVSVDELLAEYARGSFPPGRPLDQAVSHLMGRIYREFQVRPGVFNHRYAAERGPGASPRRLSGFCPPGHRLPAVAGLGGTLRERLHRNRAAGRQGALGRRRRLPCLVLVYAPGRGWLAFDPTNNQIPGERHIILAWGRDFTDVTPLKGVVSGGANHTLKVAVEVRRLG